MLTMLMRRLMGNRAVPSASDHLSDVCLMLRCLARMARTVTNTKTNTKRRDHKIVILSLVDAKPGRGRKQGLSHAVVLS
jgi:hypothetical protein